LVNVVHREGSNLAMTSGRFAAEAVIEAKKRGDFSRETLSLYDEKIKQSFIRKDLVKYKGMHDFLKEEDPDLLFNRLPQAANKAFYELFLVDGVSKAEKQKKMFQYLKEAAGGTWGLAKLGIKGWRAMNG